jgi:membrane protease YdiL (CAAX protease family)
VAPLLVAYETGVLTLGVQNGADAWMRGLLNCLGFGQHFLLPILTVCILLAWHHLTRQSWRVSPGVVSAMAVESIFLAVCLRLILQLQGSLLQSVGGAAPLEIAAKFRDGVGFLGAGIYEELLFRLVLLSLAVCAFRRSGAAAWLSTSAAIVLTSLIFAAAHYVGIYGDTLGWFSFLFRSLAGLFFSILFVYRGFGIAAGAHATYDIFVGVF